MELVVISSVGRGRAIRVCQRGLRQCRIFRLRSGLLVGASIYLCLVFLGDRALGQPPTSPTPAQSSLSAQKSLLGRNAPAAHQTVARKDSTRVAVAQPPPLPAQPAVVVAPESTLPPAKRFKVRDEFGNCVVARFHGEYGGNTALVLPDGQLGTPNLLIPTDEPFQPLTADQLQNQLRDGPFATYDLLKTNHYLIFYKSTPTFAQESGRLLEDLYDGLVEAFLRNGFPVHETEFPLVAVIFADDKDFRAHKQVDPQVQAYYEFFTNRIFFYEKSDRDKFEPKLSTILKPQTVTHEGAHQILSNIGLQPRPSAWPLWLVEGLAEYCATTVSTKKGIAWSGMGAINSLHMATLRELDDPVSNQLKAARIQPTKVARQRTMTQTEPLMLKTALTPTDYAEAWALTHYLARKRGPEFVKYLKAMSQVSPLRPRTPEENLAELRQFFEDDPAKLDKKLDEYIRKLSQKKGYDPLPFYTVIFVQPLGNGMVRRAARVSQSPQIIQQWVQEMTAPNGAEPNWEAVPRPTRARAILAAEEWMSGS
jgi:Protein of unknown function (DUF1570)